MKFRRSNNASYARSSGAGQKWVKREKIRERICALAAAVSGRRYDNFQAGVLRPATSHRRPSGLFCRNYGLPRRWATRRAATERPLRGVTQYNRETLTHEFRIKHAPLQISLSISVNGFLLGSSKYSLFLSLESRQD